MKLSIPDMNCAHCQASVMAALAPLATGVVVDLPQRQVTMQDTPNQAAVMAALGAIGFAAQVLDE